MAEKTQRRGGLDLGLGRRLMAQLVMTGLALISFFAFAAVGSFTLPMIGAASTSAASLTFEGHDPAPYSEPTSSPPCGTLTQVQVISPFPPIWRTDDQGRPLVSEAGYLQLVEDHEHVYDGFRAIDRAKWSVRTNRLDRANWGDIETMAALQRIVSAWSKRHPQGPRIGVRDISSQYGGYSDFDADGTSDHVTHQLGLNIDLLFPCRVRPEREIYFGKKYIEHYDLGLTRELVDLCLQFGANAFTTTSATKLLDDVEGQASLEHPFQLERVIDRNQTQVYSGPSPRRFVPKPKLLLLAKPQAHGSHINVQFHALP